MAAWGEGWTRSRRARFGALALLGSIALAVALLVGPVKVSVVRPEVRTLVQTVVTTGEVRAPLRSELGVEATGTVVEVLVEEGASVREGQLLLRVDARAAEAELLAARAAVDEAAARLRRMRATGAEVALAREAGAQAALEEAESRHERTKALVRAGALADQELDVAESEREVAASALAEATAQVRSATRGGADVALVVAELRRSHALLRGAEATLARTRVLAPADGVVSERRVDPGAVVQAGEALLTFLRPTPVELEVTPDEDNLAFLREGQRAYASAEPFPTDSFEARVVRIGAAVDAGRGTVDVVLEVPEPPGYLRPGMTVSVEIEVARRERALVLPVEAVEDLASSAPYVWVKRGRVAERRPVRLGARDERAVEVLEGVERDTAVIVHPSGALEPGSRVRVRRRAS